MLTSYEWSKSDACKPATSEDKAKGILSDADVGLCDTPKDTIISGASTLLAPPFRTTCNRHGYWLGGRWIQNVIDVAKVKIFETRRRLKDISHLSLAKF